MTLSKKHYTRIAAIINKNYQKENSVYIQNLFNILISDLSDYFKEDNINFNYLKFLEAATRPAQKINNKDYI